MPGKPGGSEPLAITCSGPMGHVLLHLVDANVEDVAAAWRTVRDELEAYGAGLADKPELIALNKCDLVGEELAGALSAELAAAAGAPVFAVSGATGAGVDAVLDALIDRIGATAAAEAPEEGAWSPL